MCGIIGLCCPIERARDDLDKALRLGLGELKHRGPDGSGIQSFCSTRTGQVVTLGHQRLAIFDLSASGNQPMTFGRRTIVYNGEVFNWLELRRELAALGYQFQTETDTEVVLAAFDAWGGKCVARFNGFWAFAIYDPGSDHEHASLFLSRDRFGIKPLYFRLQGGVFSFCSEIGPLLMASGSSSQIDPAALAEQLVFDHRSDEDQTLFAEVRELAPAHNARVELPSFRLSVERYWNPDDFGLKPRSDSDALDEFAYLLEDSVKLRLRSDIEVALTLSGGVDSSAIAAAIAASGSSPIRAFTSSFGATSALDETTYAQAVTRVIGLPHVLVPAMCEDLDRDEANLSRHMELLYSSFSQLVNWFVVKAISKHGIHVFLNGQGGDELFCGYERYYAPYLLNPDLSLVGRIREFVLGARNSRLRAWEMLAFMLYFSNTAIRTQAYEKRASRYLSGDLLRMSAGSAPYGLPKDMRQLTILESCGPQLRRLLRFDDRIAGAFGMEGRPVFLDHRIAEFAISLESRHKIRDGWTKHIVRRYLERRGLGVVAWRKHKLGFPAPNSQWVRELMSHRETRIRGSEFISQVLSPKVRLGELDVASGFKILAVHSVAEQMGWKMAAPRRTA